MLLKDLYNDAFFAFFSRAMKNVYPAFDESAFMRFLYDEEWEGRALKERMRHITLGLHQQLPEEYESAVTVLIDCIEEIEHSDPKPHTVEYLFFPDYIELYGVDEFEQSVQAMETITTFISCELAIRPFILRYPERAMEQMLDWSVHPHFKVRRLSSEGCRPRLPWAMALPELKKDPAPVLAILENLKEDTYEFVQKSVANNLNDISKDHPDLVIQTVKRWKGISPGTDWIVKHASRTLLKQGNEELMQLFGFGNTEEIQITDFVVHTPELSLGEYLEFSFTLVNQEKRPVNLRLEYGVYYQKANGTLSRKVFKISEKEYDAGSFTRIDRRQHFKPITTRVYHPGLHQVS
ncbi:MAG: DNA alkylation repair protein, partial [Bacteroidota bacterium]